ncbi:MAG: hypothetical protein PHU61_01090 [Candidatus Absconditabacteria bacterium]|nr:hypothetical protein [Candidatus Absconditabacteria bacterium]MDD3868106.1 hypothetical protein [Candidatus Absconditabacteria bacterium]MDD4714354.1 hypothetical protein [Candidatus Absconditabacteria bacterium]
MFHIKDFLITYGSRIKYVLSFVFIIVMLLAIRTYTNYTIIISTTNNVDEKSRITQQELDYAQNFESKYLASEYGHLFLAHDNNVIFWGESIVSFTSGTGTTTVEPMTLSHIPDRQTQLEEDKKMLTPVESWNLFIKEKLAN